MSLGSSYYNFNGADGLSYEAESIFGQVFSVYTEQRAMNGAAAPGTDQVVACTAVVDDEVTAMLRVRLLASH